MKLNQVLIFHQLTEFSYLKYIGKDVYFNSFGLKSSMIFAEIQYISARPYPGFVK